jgi:Skp family chaperone for outer membrane proteins
MKILLKAAMIAAVSTMAMTAAAPAVMAQSKLGIATANLRGAMAASNAYRVAVEQMQVTYKPQIDARNARQQALQTELQALAATYEAEAKKPGANEKSVTPSAQAFQKRQGEAQNEIAQLSQQIDLALAYVDDQISLKLDAAVKTAMEKKKVDVLLNPEAVIARAGTADISKAIVDEINLLVPSVQIVPPAGYQPGQLVAEQQRAAAAAAQPAVTPPAAQPTSR